MKKILAAPIREGYIAKEEPVVLVSKLFTPEPEVGDSIAISEGPAKEPSPPPVPKFTWVHALTFARSEENPDDHLPAEDHDWELVSAVYVPDEWMHLYWKARVLVSS